MALIHNALAAFLLVLAAFPLIAAHRGVRSSISFGPPHPGTYFTTTSLFSDAISGVNPHELAHAFMRSHMPEHTDGYFIRKDSYTDTNSGVSHVYVRQVVNGLEVADGNINLNIRDGKVLSYGNSFFKAPGDILPSPTWHQENLCASLPSTQDMFGCGSSLRRVRDAAPLYSSIPHESDPRSAAILFMLAANPHHRSSAHELDTVHAEPLSCASPSYNTYRCEKWLVSGVPGTLAPIEARKVYVQTPSEDSSATSLNLAWNLEVIMPENHYEVYVSAHDPSKIISVVDLIKDAPTPTEDGFLSALDQAVFGEAVVGVGELAKQVFFGPPEEDFSTFQSSTPGGSYRVWKWGVNDPVSGDRTLEISPSNKIASPLGWHAVPASVDPINTHSGLGDSTIVNFTTTIGNNVIAQSNWAGGDPWKSNPRPEGGKDLVFDFPYDPNLEPSQYVHASITQIFYLSNMYHDLMYLYGFNEASGNFQQYNFGKGGSEGDGIIVDAQHGHGFNAAFFQAPADGKNGRCRMHIWNHTKPFRDGGLDSGILIHELTHGLSSRLTGGPRNAKCLGLRGISGGLGEGWSDYVATSVRSTSTYQDYPIGAWAGNKEFGERGLPYSTNITVNPWLYDLLQRDDHRYNVHAIGEVWAEILWVVANKLIDKHGFAKSLFPSSETKFYRTYIREGGAVSLVPKHGNTLMLQLLVNGMKLQPCEPTFIQARDAILDADHNLTRGENKCLLWLAFASRGLGINAKELTWATNPSINGFEVPPECK